MSKKRNFTISLLDIVLIFCTGGLWLIWMFIRADMRRG